MRRRGLLFKVGLVIAGSWLLLTLFVSSSKTTPLFEVDDQVAGADSQPVQGHLRQVRGDIKNELQKSGEVEVVEEAVDQAVIPPLAKKRERKEQLPWRLPENDLVQGQGVLRLPADNPNGPGEMGNAVVIGNLTGEDKKRHDQGWENNAFNQYASDMMSLHRSLPDMRQDGCKTQKFHANLPSTSVIICFHNEAWSVLLRTVHSVIDRSPRNLLHEIILVDDFSDMAHLKKQLEDYVGELGKVKVVRATKREGLIRARLLGAKHATGEVLTYLDSHCECTPGWLEPLLTRIAEDEKNVVCPVIDVISDNNFQYHYRKGPSSVNVGGFDWNLQFNWHALPEREKQNRKEDWMPVASPTMAGGLFAINRAFFEKLGLYDSGFDIWGGENLELSFKTWMCGGRLEIVPCSHVGHVFRKRSPYKWRKGVNVLKKNSIRLAKVWMDEYSKYYYDRVGTDLGDYGDISDRVELRKNLKCKSFDWYVKTIYPELFIPGEAVASGDIRNKAFEGKWCLDSQATEHKVVSVYPCHSQGGNQYWLFSKDGEIRRDEFCLDYSGGDVILYSCHGSKGNQFWTYNRADLSVRHGSSRKCLAINEIKTGLSMDECDASNERQQWDFANYNASKILAKT